MADNIYKRLMQATQEIGAVAKNLEVGYGRNAYKAAGEADVLHAVKQVEQKCGIYSYPVARKIIGDQILESEGADGKTKRQLMMRIEVVYRFVNIDDPDDFIEITSYGDGVDSQDKAPGKAMTYADKYALMKAYKIITGEDPDQNASQDLRRAAPATISADKAKALEALLTEKGIRPEYACGLYKCKALAELTETKHANIVQHIDDIKKKQDEADQKKEEKKE